MLAVAISLSLLLSLVEGNSQTFPYVSFRGQTLANHSYLDSSLVGYMTTDSVQCHTDLTTCCSGDQGIHRGDWYFPNGDRLPFDKINDIHESRQEQRVDLRRTSATLPTGIYHCVIPTVAVHNHKSTTNRFYVGLYADGGDVSISGGFTLTVDNDGTSPQFTLACISTGGPATTVTWTRDSTTVSEGNETVLLNPITAEYVHTLKVTGDIKGRYTCTVANNKPSSASATIEYPGQPNIFLNVKSATSLNLTWDVFNITDAPYTVEWEKTGCLAKDRENSGSITTNDTSYSITGLEEGSKYNITVSTGELSNTVSAVTIEKAPSAALKVSWTFATSYSITLQWETIPCEHRNGDITGYSIKYRAMRSLNDQSETLISIIRVSVTQATISNLTLSTNYTIQIAAVNNAGTGVWNATILKTVEQSVHLSLRNKLIPNNSYVVMDDIGSTDDTALLCHTNQLSRRLSEGDWFAPSGTKVGNYTDSMPRDVPRFGRTRGPHVVRLKRPSDGTPPEGVYKCVVRDTTDINQTVYVGIYSLNGTSSSVLMSSSMVAGDSVTLTSSIFMTSGVDVTIPSSTPESTTSSHITPTQTVVYTSSEGTTTPTPTVVYSTSGDFKTPNLPFYYNSSATPTQTVAHTFSERSTLTLSTSIVQVSSRQTPTLFNSSPSLVPVVGSVICSLVILLVIVTLILLIIRYYRGSKKVKSKPPKRPPSVRDCGVWKGNQERLEMNHVAEVPGEDRDYVNLELPYNTVTARSDIPATEFPDYVRLMHQESDHRLDQEYKNLEGLPQPVSWVARLYYNTNHNRFNNINPYDYNRIQLKGDPAVEGSDYINASFIDGYPNKKRSYIASQGPTELTVERFWEMIWEYQIPTIVMLTRCVESAKVKCKRYWPEKTDTTETIGSKFEITVTSFVPYAEYQIRKMQLRSTLEPAESERTVTHMFYTAWPDHGVPYNTMSLVSFIRRVRDQHPASSTAPLLVHCSAGVGRTGTFILLDLATQQMRREGTLSVFNSLQSMRNQRMKMVQTLAQYVFVHDSLSELVMCGETEVGATNFRIKMNQLQKPIPGDPSGATGFQRQFETLEKLSSHYQASYTEALADYNSSKNRFPDKLPSKFVKIWREREREKVKSHCRR